MLGLASWFVVAECLRKGQALPVLYADVTTDELLALRERLLLSRAVFARYLRTKPRTLENWEQGRAKPNPHVALLIRLVAHA